jgi:hypothetical protein
MNTIEMRLQKLEAANKRYQRIIVMMILTASAVAFMAFGKKKTYAEVIQAKRFDVVDDYGNILVQLSQSSGMGTMRTYKTDGKRLLNLSYTTTNEGYMAVEDGYGKELLRFTSSTDGGGGYIGLYNSSGTRTLSMYNDYDGGNLSVNNNEGNSRVFMENNGSVGGLLSVRNASGYTTFKATQTTSGHGDVYVNNYNGDERIRLSVSNSAGNFQLRNNSKTLIIEAGGTNSEGGVINTFGSSGSFIQGMGSSY